MCEDCGGICAILDRMILEHVTMSGKPPEELREIGEMLDGVNREKSRYFHPTEYVGGSTSWDDTANLSDLVEQAACIDMTPQDLEDEIAKRCGFVEAVKSWIQEKKTPNGMIRLIILRNAELIIREHGARPQLTLLEAA